MSNSSLSELMALLDVLAPEIAQAAEDMDANGQIPPGLFSAIADTGALRVLLPRRLGGAGGSITDAIQVVEAVSRLDGSLGWLSFVGLSSAVFASYLDDPLAQDVYSDGDGFVSYLGQPFGSAGPDADGYRVRGTWRFASGCNLASWLACTCRRASEGDGDVIALVPRRAVTVSPNWDVFGLRATASDTVIIEDVHVPRGLTIPVDASIRPGDPLSGIGRGIVPILMAAVPLGIATAVVGEFVRFATERRARLADAPLRDREVVQDHVGRSVAALDAARAYLVEKADAASPSEGPLRLESRAEQRLAASHAAAMALQVAARIAPLAGTAPLFRSSRLGRCLRDLHAATQNLTLAEDYYAVAGRLSMGLPGPDAWP